MTNISAGDDRVVLARVGKIHGIKGWIRLESFTTPPENIFNYGPFFSASGQDSQELEIDQHKQHANGLLVHFKGIDDPEIAKAMTGTELSVRSTELPELQDGHYYWRQLLGLKVINTSGELLGEVTKLLETGANDVLVVGPDAASLDERERLIPYLLDSVIEKVDLEAGVITVNWAADYLD
ncbi:MAG: ribosome maturation factor RimM [Gammaproteobacteria bacterium]|jgi:16S rRNA processing protein RimM|nr:ribosome maturation factor RimM [Gammaproteobacteria bacterium]MDP6095487.1 ribosome maturation factor RimM [Gammaproteobacteria bacterium]MDP7455132.1 ribosome maturation factor RimM [Gammaproteobacteria bacterium]HJO10950.1 ribosome maturation factor RimM [Gammaproteobacteria bacterium]|tara:strand:- start:605 stop:1147 length:543 start_codon:yes stop_codon:yes gene_type:complete